MEREYVIIGGGVAGLCAAIRLAELGAKPLVIEAGEYPSHKVCGEFFSPECLPFLEGWGVHPMKIDSARLFAHGGNPISYQFKEPAGSLSHYTFDSQLLEIAKKAGSTVMTGTKASKFSRVSGEHLIELSNGKTVQCRNLILAVGRLPHIFPEAPLQYMGLKAHYTGLSSNQKLEMHYFDGGYVGFSPIEEGKVNVACLIEKEKVDKSIGTEAFINCLRSKNKRLNEILSNGTNQFSTWMTAGIPEFGVKAHLKWPNTYCVGDAAGTIPPITGMGLSMAIRGGIMVAEFSFKNNPEGYRKEWLKTFKTPIAIGKSLHAIAIRKSIGKPLFSLGKLFPSLLEKIFQMTR
jgi:menaquinone-9 beta-reductase